MLNFEHNNQYKLYNLAEALQLDDYADTELHNDEPETLTSKSNIVQFNRFEEFAKSRLLSNNDQPLKPIDEILIKQVNSDTSDEFTGLVMVQSYDQLVEVLQRGLKYFGFEGNYNWINTSNVEKMTNLFPNTFGSNCEKFNGDISKWNTSKVNNMMYIFKGCASLTCDISHWDTSNVIWWSSESYAGTPPVFQEMCKKLKFPKKVLRTLR